MKRLILLALTLPLLLVSCGALQPVEDKAVNHLLDPVIADSGAAGASPAIAISRPSLPSYLDRQQLVSRTGDGRVQMNGYHLWAEPLDAAISRITAINLGRLTRSLNIQPVENFVTLDYQSLLEIRISRFEPDESNHMILECTWKLQQVNGRVADTRAFLTRVPISNLETSETSGSAKDLSGRIAAMNEALGRLAREIARTL
jgi:uncharacterized lipoprotein YmbA